MLMEMPMFKDIVPLDRAALAGYMHVPPANAAHARNVLIAPLALSEIVKAAREFPVVFPADGPLRPLALLGFRDGDNLHVDENGSWTARYMPAHLRRYPFVLGETDEKGRFLVMVDRAALVEEGEGDGEGQGEPLFIDGAVPKGGIVERAEEFLVAFQRELEKAEAFLSPLKEADVLVRKTFSIEQDGQILGRVTDMLVVDEARLAELAPGTLAEWVRSGLMGLVMAHLHSLDNWSGRIFNRAGDTAA